MGTSSKRTLPLHAPRSPARPGHERPEGECPDWRTLLAGPGPREVLARLLEGDPLGLRAVVAERLRARAYLLDADRVYLRSLARVARYALRYRGAPELPRWLADVVDESLIDLIEDDREHATAAGLAPAGPRGPYGPYGPGGPGGPGDLARPLGLDARAMRVACARLHGLPEEQRQAFFALVIEGRELDELARRGPDSATAIARRARRALLCVLAGDAGRTKTAGPNRRKR